MKPSLICILFQRYRQICKYQFCVLFCFLFYFGFCVWGGVCVWGVCVCVCLAYTTEDFHMKTPRHTEDSTPSEDPKTGPRKTLAKNAENVMFYHLRGVRAPRTSMDFQPYLIYEDIRVLGSISKASRCVCVCVCFVLFLFFVYLFVCFCPFFVFFFSVLSIGMFSINLTILIEGF